MINKNRKHKAIKNNTLRPMIYSTLKVGAYTSVLGTFLLFGYYYCFREPTPSVILLFVNEWYWFAFFFVWGALGSCIEWCRRKYHWY